MGLCGSFQEPTLLSEWAIPAFKTARKRRLKYCCYVSNGYMTLPVLHALCEAGLDGLKGDVKGDSRTYERFCGGADVEKVWRNACEAKKLGVHVEVVNLVVSGVSDDEETLRWVVGQHLKSVGAKVPLHFTKYSPAYRFESPPTKVEVLEWAHDLAKKEGVKYVYLGNVEGHRYESTYCAECGEKVIGRYGPQVVKYDVTEDGKCPKCGCSVPIVGRFTKNFA